MADPKPLPAFITAVTTPSDGLDVPFYRGKKLVDHDMKERAVQGGGPGTRHSRQRAWGPADNSTQT